MTNAPEMRDRSVVRLSVMPSVKYSCSLPPAILANGRTTMESRGGEAARCVAGRATVEGGVMIDLARMKGVYVDASRQTVRAQGGVTWAELNRETQLHGLAVTGGVVSTTGIAGLTLGGGIGWLMGKYGLALDNLQSVELVTAEGRVLRGSAEENPDLFWAVRGGGGNFGVVTSPVVTTDMVITKEETLGPVAPLYRFKTDDEAVKMANDTATLPSPACGGICTYTEQTGPRSTTMMGTRPGWAGQPSMPSARRVRQPRAQYRSEIGGGRAPDPSHSSYGGAA